MGVSVHLIKGTDDEESKSDYRTELLSSEYIDAVSEIPVLAVSYVFDSSCCHNIDMKEAYVICTSVRGVKAYLHALEAGMSAARRLYALGGVTWTYASETTTRYGTEVRGNSSIDAATLAQEIIEESTPATPLVHLCSSIALPTLEEMLLAAGRQYLAIVAYEIVALPRESIRWPALLQDGEVIVFFSPSGIRAILQHKDIRESILSKACAVGCIGKTTAKAYNAVKEEFRELPPVSAIAEAPTPTGLQKSLTAYLQRKTHSIVPSTQPS